MESSFLQTMEYLTQIKFGSLITFKHGHATFRGLVEDFNDEIVRVAIINKFGHHSHTCRTVSTTKITKVENIA